MGRSIQEAISIRVDVIEVEVLMHKDIGNACFVDVFLKESKV